MNKFEELNLIELDLVNGAGNGLFASEEDAIACEGDEITSVADFGPQGNTIFFGSSGGTGSRIPR